MSRTTRGPSTWRRSARADMGRFALARLGSMVGILFALSVIVFMLESVIPADPVRVMVGASATRATVQAKRHELGLDQPLPVQYVRFLRRAGGGGPSMSPHTPRPVTRGLGD